MQDRLLPLDTLRSFAILAVIAVHTVQVFPSNIPVVDVLMGLGRYGVQLFFVISGFTMMLVSEKASLKPNFAKAFYIKRFMRILPLYYLAAIFYIPLHFLGVSFFDQSLNVWNYILNFSLLSGWSPEALNSVVPGGWSIINELYFYLLFPLILPLLKGLKALPYLLTFSLLSVVSIWIPDFVGVLYLTEPSIQNDFVYFNFLNQLPCFLFGMLSYHACYHKDKNKAILIAIVALVISLSVKFIMGGNFVVFFTSFSALVLIVVNLRFLKFSCKPLVVCGQMTYSGYIVHWGVIAVLSLFVDYNFFIMFPTVALVTFLICFFIKPYVEDAPQKLAKRLVLKYYS